MKLRQRFDVTTDELEAWAEKHGVLYRAAFRAYVGHSWRQPMYKVMPLQWKRCKWCGEKFERRFTNGRYRCDEHWQQKETCSVSCALHLMWSRGTYANRRR